MLWKTIKKILQKQGGKCIILEEDQPAYLVMKIDDYEEEPEEDQAPEIDKVNKDINEWKENENQGDGEAVKIEDLPF